MVTMADVARLAGVSVTTVSHVINGTRPASERTTRAVRAAIERTGYSQNVVARALARQRTQSLGLAISGLSNPYFTDVIAAVEGAATAAGHTLLLAETRDDPEQELKVVRALVERRVDGLLLAPSPGAERMALPYLATQDAPVVLLDRFVESAALDQVGSENGARRRSSSRTWPRAGTGGSGWSSASPASRPPPSASAATAPGCARPACPTRAT